MNDQTNLAHSMEFDPFTTPALPYTPLLDSVPDSAVPIQQSEPRLETIESEPAPTPETDSITAVANCVPIPLPIPSPHSDHRRTGQIARLPKLVRDRLNGLIEDGVPYLDIIQRMATGAPGLTEDKLSKWKNSGYRDWLEEQRVADAVRARYEFASTLVEGATDSSQAGRAVLHTMAVNLCYMLADMDPSGIRESLLSDSDKFGRFVNTLVRLAEGGAKCEESRAKLEFDQAQKARAALPPEERGISDEALARAQAKLALM